MLISVCTELLLFVGSTVLGFDGENLLTTTIVVTHMPVNKPNKPPSLHSNLTHIETSISSILSACVEIECKHPTGIDKLALILQNFYSDLTSTLPHLQILPPNPKEVLDKLEGMRENINMLQRAVIKLQNSPTTLPPKPANPNNRQDTPSPPLADDTKKPTSQPSIIIHSAFSETNGLLYPHFICQTINKQLKHSEQSQICISAAKWTTKGNIILTGGANNLIDQLLSARPIIQQAFISCILDFHPTSPLPSLQIKNGPRLPLTESQKAHHTHVDHGHRRNATMPY